MNVVMNVWMFFVLENNLNERWIVVAEFEIFPGHGKWFPIDFSAHGHVKSII